MYKSTFYKSQQQQIQNNALSNFFHIFLVAPARPHLIPLPAGRAGPAVQLEVEAAGVTDGFAGRRVPPPQTGPRGGAVDAGGDGLRLSGGNRRALMDDGGNGLWGLQVGRDLIQGAYLYRAANRVGRAVGVGQHMVDVSCRHKGLRKLGRLQFTCTRLLLAPS